MLSSLLITWLATAIGLGIAVLMVNGLKLKTISAFLIAAAVLRLINVFIRPLLWLLTAPLSVLSLGLFALVINAFMIMLAAAMVPNFEVKSFTSAFLGAIIMAIIGILGFIAEPLIRGDEIHWTSYEYHSQTHQQP